MIISRGRRYIFVHIPKTGGTAMAMALEARAMRDDILIGDTPKAVRRRGRLKDVKTAGRLWKHSTLADAEGLITRDEMADLMIVTLVRNPWDRIVSYYHWLQAQRFDHAAVKLAQSLDFGAFLNHPHTQSSLAANPYAHYVTDGVGIVHDALFARLEHWRDDLGPFSQHLGFDLDLPRANTSDRARDWRGYYSDEDADLVGRLCEDDIARSGYRFDPQA